MGVAVLATAPPPPVLLLLLLLLFCGIVAAAASATGALVQRPRLFGLAFNGINIMRGFLIIHNFFKLLRVVEMVWGWPACTQSMCFCLNFSNLPGF